VAALGAAVLGAMGGAFGSSNRSEEYFGSAAANQTLVDRARDFRTTVAPHQPLDEVRKRFTELCEERDNTVARSPLRLGVRATKLFRGDRTPSALDRALGNQKPAGD
ncbi:MAG: hypothetical protein ACRDT4_22965, partial [Micromonosporaceae bacterium]